MKFIHLGDLHIGKSLKEYDLIDDQTYILDRILEIAEEKKTDGILIAGDVYDKAVPSEKAVMLFDSFLKKAVEKKQKIFIISGNHDSDERLNFGSSFFEDRGIYISSIYNGKLYHQTFEDEYGPIHIYLLPFIKASQVRFYFPEEEIGNYDDAVRVAVKNESIDENERNIIIAHQFVVGNGKETVLSGSEGLAVKNVGTIEQISYRNFDAFDYVALGHIHSPQEIGRETVRYSGSPLKYSLSEANNEKSVPVVTFMEKGKVEIELVPLVPRRDLRHLKGKLKDLLKPENIVDPEDYIYVTLTDEEISGDVSGIIRASYPNFVCVDFDNQHTKSMRNEEEISAKMEKAFPDLISDFFKNVYGTDISDEELEVMKKIAKEAGVIDETN